MKVTFIVILLYSKIHNTILETFFLRVSLSTPERIWKPVPGYCVNMVLILILNRAPAFYRVHLLCRENILLLFLIRWNRAGKNRTRHKL